MHQKICGMKSFAYLCKWLNANDDERQRTTVQRESQQQLSLLLQRPMSPTRRMPALGGGPEYRPENRRRHLCQPPLPGSRRRRVRLLLRQHAGDDARRHAPLLRRHARQDLPRHQERPDRPDLPRHLLQIPPRRPPHHARHARPHRERLSPQRLEASPPFRRRDRGLPVVACHRRNPKKVVSL